MTGKTLSPLLRISRGLARLALVDVLASPILHILIGIGCLLWLGF